MCTEPPPNPQPPPPPPNFLLLTWNHYFSLIFSLAQLKRNCSAIFWSNLKKIRIYDSNSTMSCFLPSSAPLALALLLYERFNKLLRFLTQLHTLINTNLYNHIFLSLYSMINWTGTCEDTGFILFHAAIQMCHQAIVSCSRYVLCLPCKGRGVGAYKLSNNNTNIFKLLFWNTHLLERLQKYSTYNIITLIRQASSLESWYLFVSVSLCSNVFRFPETFEQKTLNRGRFANTT